MGIYLGNGLAIQTEHDTAHGLTTMLDIKVDLSFIVSFNCRAFTNNVEDNVM